MKILLVNTFDRGGAAIACLRLHSGLLTMGIESNVLLKSNQKQLPNTYKFKPSTKKISFFQKLLRAVQEQFSFFFHINKYQLKEKEVFLKNRDERLEYFSFPDSTFDITSSKLYQEADIINLHWVADFFDFESFFKLNTKPVVWTLHDMNPFTGGEHYEEAFLGINNNGYPLKRIISAQEQIIFKKNKSLKQKALKGVDNLHIITLCKWMYNEVKKNSLFKNCPIHLIPNGIDATVFKNTDRNYSKTLFKLPLDKTIVLFVADAITNNRKGFAYLKQAFEGLKNKDVILCAIGHLDGGVQLSDNIIELGTIKDEEQMCHIYNAADVFVIPSLMDNLPNTVIESLLCGTPVIGFPVGGILDMVAHGKNGLLAKEVSVDALLESLNIFLNTIEHFDREVIRTEAIKKYDLKVQSKAYLTLFENILNKK